MASGTGRGVVFASWTEVKQNAGAKHKHLRFYLVDESGREHLAVEAHDQGDAHYTYKSTPAVGARFGPLDSHNRGQTLMWLERAVRESQGGAGAGGPDGIQIQAAGEKLYFVHSKQVRLQYPDGRRLQKWLLVDQHGSEHDAVMGEEREARDGHYTYHAVEPFASLQPLTCGNQAGVLHWLEQMISHHQSEAGVTGLPAAATQALRDAEQAGRLRGGLHVLDLSSTRKAQPRGSSELRGLADHLRPVGPAPAGGEEGAAGPSSSQGAAGEAAGQQAAAGTPPQRPGGSAIKIKLPASAAGTSKTPGAGLPPLPPLVWQTPASQAMPPPLPPPKSAPKNTGQFKSKQQAGASAAKLAAEAAAKRGQKRGPGELPDADEAALQSGHVAKLRRQAAAEAARRESAKTAALGWATRPLAGEAALALAHWRGALAALAEDRLPESASGPGSAAYRTPFNQRHHVRQALEALRELAGLHCSLRSLLESKVADVVRPYRAYPHPGVAAAAGRLLDRWALGVAQAVDVLAGELYMQDPVQQLETRLATGQEPLPTIQRRPAAVPTIKVTGVAAPLPGGLSPATTALLASGEASGPASEQQLPPAS